MSNFSFSHSVFRRLLLQTRKNQGLFGKGLTKPHDKDIQEIRIDQPFYILYNLRSLRPDNQIT